MNTRVQGPVKLPKSLGIRLISISLALGSIRFLLLFLWTDYNFNLRVLCLDCGDLVALGRSILVCLLLEALLRAIGLGIVAQAASSTK